MCIPDSCICQKGYIRISEEDQTCVPEHMCSLYYDGTDSSEEDNTSSNGTLIFPLMI